MASADIGFWHWPYSTKPVARDTYVDSGSYLLPPSSPSDLAGADSPSGHSNSTDGLPGVGYLLPPVNPGLGRQQLMVVEGR